MSREVLLEMMLWNLLDRPRAGVLSYWLVGSGHAPWSIYELKEGTPGIAVDGCFRG